jgi:hypothetical protein
LIIRIRELHLCSLPVRRLHQPFARRGCEIPIEKRSPTGSPPRTMIVDCFKAMTRELAGSSTSIFPAPYSTPSTSTAPVAIWIARSWWPFGIFAVAPGSIARRSLCVMHYGASGAASLGFAGRGRVGAEYDRLCRWKCNAPMWRDWNLQLVRSGAADLTPRPAEHAWIVCHPAPPRCARRPAPSRGG